MNVPTKLAAFGALSAAVFTAALGVGAAIGPVDTPDRPTTHIPSADGAHDTTGGDDMLAMDHTAATPGGLETSRDGYSFAPIATTLATGGAVEYGFTIDGPDGLPVTEFVEEHDKELHLIVVRRDLSGYQHLHPTLGAGGVWTATADLSVSGTYRVLADFTPAGLGEGLTLGVDLQVPGDQRPIPLPVPSRAAEVDGYTVRLTGDLVPGSSSMLTLSVDRDGRPVTDLEPYLGTYGHLVALRSGDVAYLHVHPEGAPGDGATTAGPSIEFAAAVPSAGTYRLYLDFLHDGQVRTAEFTVVAGAVPTAPADRSATTTTITGPAPAHDDRDGHHTNGAGR